MKIDRIDASHCLVGECPMWDDEENALYFLDIPMKKVHRLTHGTGEVRTWDTPAPPGAIALRRDGSAVVAMKDQVYFMDFATGTCEAVARAADQPADATFNDGKLDRQGRFVIGSCSTNFTAPTPIGGIYSFDNKRQLTKAAGDIAFSNSPCFSPDGSTFYFSDCSEYTLFAYEYDPASDAVGQRRPLLKPRELGGMPDGATVDRDGLVWLAIMEGGKVVAVRPDGAIERIIEMPVALPSSVMFGGPSLDLLFVTTADPVFSGRPSQVGTGCVHIIEGIGARGLPEPRFDG